mgnify:CR=1 FL=1
MLVYVPAVLYQSGFRPVPMCCSSSLKYWYGWSDPWTQFRPWHWRWRDDQNNQLFFTKQRVEGMGGFTLYLGSLRFRPKTEYKMDL